jgi:hypothetical protein
MKKIIATGLVLGLVLSMAFAVSASKIENDDIAIPPIPPVSKDKVQKVSDPITLDHGEDDPVLPPVPPDLIEVVVLN